VADVVVAMRQAMRAGRPFNFADAEADVDRLRALLLRPPQDTDPRGLTIKHAHLNGLLDLSGASIPYPVRFEHCHFADALQLEGAHLKSLAMVECVATALLGNGAVVDLDLNLQGSTVAGAQASTASTSKEAAVWLCEAKIGGRLLCVDTTLRAPGQRAMQADRVEIGGTVRFIHQFEAQGEIRMIGATIGGSLDLTGAHLHRPLQGLALDLAEATVGGSVFIIPSKGRRPSISGRIDLGGARVAGRVILREAELAPVEATVRGAGYNSQRASGSAISAPRLYVGGHLSIERGCAIRGGIDLSTADLGGLAIAEECQLSNAHHVALNLSSGTCQLG